MARKPAPVGSDRRQLILEGALDAFAEQGFEGATSKAIGERAQVAPGLIYFYFDTKEDLFRASVEFALERELERLDFERLLRLGDGPEETLTRAMTKLLDALNSPTLANLTRVMAHMMAHKDRRAGPLHECKRHMVGAIELVTRQLQTYLDEQVTAGRLRPVNTEMVARFLIGSAITSVRWARTSEGERRKPAEIARVMITTCLWGLLPSPGAPPASTETAPDPDAALVAPAVER